MCAHRGLVFTIGNVSEGSEVAATIAGGSARAFKRFAVGVSPTKELCEPGSHERCAAGVRDAPYVSIKIVLRRECEPDFSPLALLTGSSLSCMLPTAVRFDEAVAFGYVL